MHVTMTQGVTVVDVSMTRDEARALERILDVSHKLKLGSEVEKVSQRLFDALWDAGVGLR